MIGHRTRHHIFDHKSKYMVNPNCPIKTMPGSPSFGKFCHMHYANDFSIMANAIIKCFSNVCPRALLRNLSSFYTYNVCMRVSGHVLPKFIMP